MPITVDNYSNYAQELAKKAIAAKDGYDQALRNIGDVVPSLYKVPEGAEFETKREAIGIERERFTDAKKTVADSEKDAELARKELVALKQLFIGKLAEDGFLVNHKMNLDELSGVIKNADLSKVEKEAIIFTLTAIHSSEIIAESVTDKKKETNVQIESVETTLEKFELPIKKELESQERARAESKATREQEEAAREAAAIDKGIDARINGPILAKVAVEKSAKPLKEKLLEAVEKLNSKSSLEIISKLAAEGRLTGEDLKQVQEAANKKIGERSSFRKVADFFITLEEKDILKNNEGLEDAIKLNQKNNTKLLYLERDAAQAQERRDQDLKASSQSAASKKEALTKASDGPNGPSRGDTSVLSVQLAAEGKIFQAPKGNAKSR